MENRPKVTALIDTYNYGQFIEEAVDSVLAQDFPPEQMEVFVVDDGSTDDTAKRVRKYGDRIQYLYKPNGGQASAFNFGLAQARGEIIAFLDADDYWLPGKLHRVVEGFEEHPDVGMVYHAMKECVSQTGELRDAYFSCISGYVPANRKDLLNYMFCPTSTLAFRRSTIEPLLPIPEGLTIQADGHLSALVIFLAPVFAIPEPLAVYRIHGQNLYYADNSEASRNRLERRVQTGGVFVEDIRAWLTKHGQDLNRGDLRAYFKRWSLPQEADEFTLAPPGRFRLFRHLLEYPRFFAPRMTWRHQTVSYINAFGSLFLGYKHFHLLDEWRLGIKRFLRGLFKQGAPPLQEKAARTKD